jgi:hypothetical protein
MFTCPVCHADESTVAPYESWPPPHGAALTPPYEDALDTPSIEVCANCGFEFGNDDNPRNSLAIVVRGVPHRVAR